MQKKKAFILYNDYSSHFERLSDDEAGKLIKAVFHYVNTGEVLELPSCAGMAFSFIACQLDRDIARYDEIREKRSAAAFKRWHGDADECNCTEEYTDECKSIDCNAVHGKKEIIKDKEKEKENVNVIDSEKEKEHRGITIPDDIYVPDDPKDVDVNNTPQLLAYLKKWSESMKDQMSGA